MFLFLFFPPCTSWFQLSVFWMLQLVNYNQSLTTVCATLLESPSSPDAQTEWSKLCCRSFNQINVRVAKSLCRVMTSWRVHWLDLAWIPSSSSGIWCDLPQISDHRRDSIGLTFISFNNTVHRNCGIRVIIDHSGLPWLSPKHRCWGRPCGSEAGPQPWCSHSQHALPVCLQFRRQTEKEKTICVDCLELLEAGEESK